MYNALPWPPSASQEQAEVGQAEPSGGRRESADKPGSVVGNHSSGIRVTAYLKQPTREHVWATRAARSRLPPYLALLQAGFTVPSSVTTDAVRSYRTLSPLPVPPRGRNLGGLLSVALSVGSRPPGVTWRLALWSPDFPPCPPVKMDTAVAWLTPGAHGAGTERVAQAMDAGATGLRLQA